VNRGPEEEEEKEEKGSRRRATALLRLHLLTLIEDDQRRRGRACKSGAATPANASLPQVRCLTRRDSTRGTDSTHGKEDGREPHEQQQQSTGIDGVCRSMEGLINV
ncbi:hypothetical protein CORC01_00237, partial [Colletotrichum orchidophilum]